MSFAFVSPTTETAKSLDSSSYLICHNFLTEAHDILSLKYLDMGWWRRLHRVLVRAAYAARASEHRNQAPSSIQAPLQTQKLFSIPRGSYPRPICVQLSKAATFPPAETGDMLVLAKNSFLPFGFPSSEVSSSYISHDLGPSGL